MTVIYMTRVNNNNKQKQNGKLNDIHADKLDRNEEERGRILLVY